MFQKKMYISIGNIVVITLNSIPSLAPLWLVYMHSLNRQLQHDSLHLSKYAGCFLYLPFPQGHAADSTRRKLGPQRTLVSKWLAAL